MPHDIEKLKKERPEMFDFADIPDNLDVDPRYAAAMHRLAPQWFKDFAAKRPIEIENEPKKPKP